MAEDINNLKIEVAVINNKLDNLETKTDKILSMLEKHIEDEETNRQHFMETKADKKEVDDIKNNQRWVVTTALGAVIVGIINYFFNK